MHGAARGQYKRSMGEALKQQGGKNEDRTGAALEFRCTYTTKMICTGQRGGCEGTVCGSTGESFEQQGSKNEAVLKWRCTYTTKLICTGRKSDPKRAA